MSNKKRPQISPAPAKKPLNLSVAPDVAELFSKLCSANYKSGSMSAEVEKLMVRTIATKGQKYGLRLPDRYAA